GPELPRRAARALAAGRILVGGHLQAAEDEDAADLDADDPAVHAAGAVLGSGAAEQDPPAATLERSGTRLGAHDRLLRAARPLAAARGARAARHPRAPRPGGDPREAAAGAREARGGQARLH